MIYTISLSIALTALLSWFLVQRNEVLAKLFRVLLGAAVMIYGVTVVAAAMPMDAKFATVFRDLLILGGVGVLGTVLSQRRLLTPALTVGVLIALNAFLLPKLASDFNTNCAAVYDNSIDAEPTLAANGLDEDGELLVGFNEKVILVRGGKYDLLLKKYGLKDKMAFQPLSPEITLLDETHVLDVPTTQLKNLDLIKKELSDLTDVMYVENNEYITLDDQESQPVINKTGYAINDPGLEFSWGFSPMKVNDLYTFLQKTPLRPFKKARLAILDTGIDAQHEDIAANYVSTQKKYDNDPKGHGTHCAGIAAAVSNNGRGIASYALNSDFVEVTSIKVLNSYGIGTQQGIINGIIEAADSGADVISMSLGGRSSDSKQRAYEKAVKYANKKGAIVIVAAGNSNRNAKEYAPANSKGAITVTAIDDQLQRAVFSNYINDIDMGIAAPGVNIYSLIPNNQYATYNGTSMATPYVSGLVAMLKSINPELTTKEVYQILNQTGIETKNTTETGKLIQPLRALQQVLD